MSEPQPASTLVRAPWYERLSPSITAWTRGAWYTLAAIVLLPLAFAFVQTPIQFSDVLTGPHMFYSPKGDFTSASEIAPNYVHSLFHSIYLMRPTQVLFNNVQYVLFGPEPGAMYAVKWAMKFASALLVLSILRRLGVDDLSRFATGTLVLFHPACLDPLLWSADGQAAFLMLATLALSLRFAETGNLLQIDRLKWPQYLALFVVWFLTLGAKEVCFVYCGCLVLVWQAVAYRSGLAWLKLAPFYSALAFWAYRLAGLGRVSASKAIQFSDIAERVKGQLRLICPPSPRNSLSWICLLLIGLAVVYLVRRNDVRTRWSILLFAAAAIGGVLFISIPEVRPSSRYVISLIYLFALLVGVGMSRLPRAAWPAKAILVFLIPAWMAGDLYTQTLSFVQDMYEYNEALNYLESGTSRGFGIACSGRLSEQGCFEREAQETVKYYFEKYGPQFFGLPRATHVSLLKDGDRPSYPYYLMTSLSLAELEQGAIEGLDADQISGAVQIERQRLGPLAQMRERYVWLESQLGNDHTPPYDVGTVALSHTSRYYIYAVDGARRHAGDSLPIARVRPTYHPGAFIR